MRIDIAITELMMSADVMNGKLIEVILDEKAFWAFARAVDRLDEAEFASVVYYRGCVVRCKR